MQRYFAKNKNDSFFILEDTDIHHILHVMRMNNNERIEVVYHEQLYLCELEITNDFKIKILEIKDNLIHQKHITLIVPLIKEQKLDLILQKSTELGVSEIMMVEMQRSVVKMIGEKEEKKIERWTRICKEASEQSMRLNIPVIRLFKNLRDIKIDNSLKLICSTQNKNNTIRKVLQSLTNYDKIAVVMGPEGGFTNQEEEYLTSVGFIPVSLGENIMRVETVPLFILSIINYENME